MIRERLPILLSAALFLGPAGVDDVPAAFSRLPDRARPIPFELPPATLPGGGHVQGVHCSERHCFVSGSSDAFAYLMRIDLVPGRGLVRWMQDVSAARPTWRHAGGLQASGTVLAVGLEDADGRRDSEVQLWDVSDAAGPRRLPCTIPRQGRQRETHTAGAVGIVARESGYVLAVANWDSRDVDFYATNGAPLDERACFAHTVRWSARTADRSMWAPDRDWGAYQAVSLLAEPDGDLFLIGTYTRGAFRQRDVVDLFAVDLTAEPPEILRKLAARRIDLGGARFRCAGAVRTVGRELAIDAAGCGLAPLVSTEPR